MRKLWYILILPALLLLWWVVERRDAAVTVHVAVVGQGRIESTVPTNGKVEPVTWAAARSEVTGVVRTIAVQRGQTVKAGDLLVSLDLTSAQADLAAATAKAQEARSETATLGAGGKASQVANIDASIRSSQTAIDVAGRNFETQTRLAAQSAATKLSVQDSKDALDRARQQLAAYEAQRRTLVTTSDKTVAEAKLRDAQAAVALAQHRLTLASIRAPISGTVYQFDIKLGAYLIPGQTVALIGNLDQIKIAVYVDEPDLGRVAPKLPVAITWEGKPGQKWWGHVEKMPTEVVTLGTRNVGEVSTVVDNPEHDLLPGVTVNATIVSKVVENATIIPKAALRTIGAKTGAYRLRDGNQLEWAQVEAGISDINNVQVLSGVAKGDKVVDRVVDPADAEITAGMRVRVAQD